MISVCHCCVSPVVLLSWSGRRARFNADMRTPQIGSNMNEVDWGHAQDADEFDADSIWMGIHRSFCLCYRVVRTIWLEQRPSIDGKNLAGDKFGPMTGKIEHRG